MKRLTVPAIQRRKFEGKTAEPLVMLTAYIVMAWLVDPKPDAGFGGFAGAASLAFSPDGKVLATPETLFDYETVADNVLQFVTGRLGAARADGLETLREFTRDVKSGRASFTQTVTSPDGVRKKTASGSFEGWTPLHGSAITPQNSFSNAWPYSWSSVDFTAYVDPTDDPGLTGIRLYARGGSSSLVINRVELCLDAQ